MPAELSNLTPSGPGWFTNPNPMDDVSRTSQKPPEDSAPGRSIAAILTYAGWVFLAGVAAPAVAALFGRWFWPAELATHFHVPYLIGAVAALLLLLAGRAWRSAALAFVLVVWQGAAIVPWYLPVTQAGSDGGARIRILSANVNAGNSDHDAFLDFVKETRPDVIFVQELSPPWDHALQALGAKYPHMAVRVQPDNFGIGVFSKYPLEDVYVGDVSGVQVPVVTADADVRGTLVHLVNIHGLPPVTPGMAALRNRQLAWLGEYAAGVDGPLIAAGDLNCTMWSSFYQRMIDTGGFRDARRGHGVAPTWLSILGVVPLLPLDHVITSEDILIEDFQVGPDIGSDHRPVVATLRVPAD